MMEMLILSRDMVLAVLLSWIGADYSEANRESEKNKEQEIRFLFSRDVPSAPARLDLISLEHREPAKRSPCAETPFHS